MPIRTQVLEKALVPAPAPTLAAVVQRPVHLARQALQAQLQIYRLAFLQAAIRWSPS